MFKVRLNCAILLECIKQINHNKNFVLVYLSVFANRVYIVNIKWLKLKKCDSIHVYLLFMNVLI